MPSRAATPTRDPEERSSAERLHAFLDPGSPLCYGRDDKEAGRMCHPGRRSRPGIRRDGRAPSGFTPFWIPALRFATAGMTRKQAACVIPGGVADPGSSWTAERRAPSGRGLGPGLRVFAAGTTPKPCLSLTPPPFSPTSRTFMDERSPEQPTGPRARRSTSAGALRSRARSALYGCRAFAALGR